MRLPSITKSRVCDFVPGDYTLVDGIVAVTTGSELAFVDRGVHVLKGVPGDWQLFAVDTALR